MKSLDTSVKTYAFKKKGTSSVKIGRTKNLERRLNTLTSMSGCSLEIEQEIQDKGLTAPRLTPALIDAAIKSEDYHVFGDTCLTVCCLTLQNGFTVTGESACASPENFNAEIGRKIARENARNKIWMLEGYLLKQRLFETQNQMPPAI